MNQTANTTEAALITAQQHTAQLKRDHAATCANCERLQAWIDELELKLADALDRAEIYLESSAYQRQQRQAADERYLALLAMGLSGAQVAGEVAA